MRRAATKKSALAVVSAVLLLGISPGCQHSRSPPGAAPDGIVSAEQTRQERANRAARSLDAADIRASEATRVEELFAGRFAGVRVVRHPSGGLSVRVRGASRVTGDNEPLFVIDGMPIEAAPGGAMVGLNPADIQRIEVLKDIGSTAF